MLQAITPQWNHFFSLLQNNALNRHTWDTRAELPAAIATWIKRTYHQQRKQARLGRLTPIKYETIIKTQIALTA